MENEHTQFVSTSLAQERYFSWVFLVYWILTLITSLTTIFYLTRVLAYLVTLLLELILWKTLKIKVNLESLRISLLTGTIFFKNLCIIDQDQTISIMEGRFVWRYWLIKSRISEIILMSQSSGGEEEINYKKNSKLPSMFSFEAKGFEVFVYNRKVSYQNTVKLFSKEEQQKFSSFLNTHDFADLFSEETVLETAHHMEKDNNNVSFETNSTNSTAVNDRVFNSTTNQRKSLLLDLLPMELKFAHGSVVLGNKFTESLLIVSFRRGEGIVDLCPPREKIDLYKVKLDVDFEDVELTIKPNLGHDPDFESNKRFHSNKISRLWGSFTSTLDLISIPLHNRRSKKNTGKELDENELFMNRWRGLSLYKNSAYEIHKNEFEFGVTQHDYARTSSILKCAKLGFTYEFDSPGIVPHGAHPTLNRLDGPDIGNNGSPPEFGIDLKLTCPTINYGPWSHRQLQELSKMLFPVVSRDQKPVRRLLPGARRMYTVLKVTVSIEDEASWRLPTRESSKDHDFIKKFLKTKDDFRAFGWLDMKFLKGSEAIYTLSLVPTENGTNTEIDFHIVGMELTTSVNHDLFLRSSEFDVRADMKYPLGWNSGMKWSVNFESQQLETFLLREHVTLVNDALTDFSSSDPTPYELFRPFDLEFDWKLHGYSIYLNVNDRNIINSPLDFNENCYLSFHGDLLNIAMQVASTSISQSSKNIQYSISTPMFRLMLNSPPWNTLNEFMKEKEVGRSHDFKVTGSYLIYPELDVDNVDTITIDCTSKGTALYCYGYVAKYLMNVQANYFGDFVRFITSEEYLDIMRKEEGLDNEYSSVDVDSMSTANNSFSSVKINKPQDTINDSSIKRSGLIRTKNESDIWFTFNVSDGALILPEALYGSDTSIALCFTDLDISFRTNNYYMDFLTTIFDVTMKRYIGKETGEILEYIHTKESQTHQTHGKISELSIHAHRMFGLPPKELTYYCQWTVNIGVVLINSNINFVTSLFGALKKFGFGYSNAENKLIFKSAAVDDLTLFTVWCDSLLINIKEESADLELKVALNDIKYTSIDFQNSQYTKRIDLVIPEIVVALVQCHPTITKLMDLKLQVELTNFVLKPDMKTNWEKQKDYITLHDSPYHRCFFLLPKDYQASSTYQELHGSITPSFSLPMLPLPLSHETSWYIYKDFFGKDYEPWIKVEGDYSPAPTLFTEITGEYFQETASSVQNTVEHKESKSILLPPGQEFDNYSVKINSIDFEVNSELGVELNKITTFMKDDDILDTIDNIEMVIVSQLSNLKPKTLLQKNFKISVPIVRLFWGVRNMKGISVDFEQLTFETQQNDLEEGEETSSEGSLMLTKFRSLKTSIYDNLRSKQMSVSEIPSALTLTLDGLEAWTSNTFQNVISLDLFSMDLTIDETQLLWLSDYLKDQVRMIGQLTTFASRISSHAEFHQKCIISKLITASEFYQINHDPYVITKPAFIVRLSKGHVRENRSWRIVTRLRHILLYLPDDWESTLQENDINDELDVEKDAENVFLNVFSKWRNWEVSDVTRSFIYKKLFTGHEEEKKINNKIKIKFESFFFTLYSNGFSVNHNISVTRSNLVIHKIPKTVESSLRLNSTSDVTFDITGKLGSIKCEVSETILKFRDILGANGDHEDSEQAVPAISVSNSYKLNFLLLFERVDCRLNFFQNQLNSRIVNGKITSCYENLKDFTNSSGSVVLFMERAEIWLKNKNSLLFDSQVRNFFVSTTVELFSRRLSFLVNLNCSAMKMNSVPETQILVPAIQDLKEKVEQMKKILTTPPEDGLSKSLSNPSSRSLARSSFKVVDVVVDAEISNITTELILCSPFGVKHSTKKFSLNFNRLGNNDLTMQVLNTDVQFKSHSSDEIYLKISYDKIEHELQFCDENSPLISSKVSAELMKLTISDPRKLISSYLNDEVQFKKSFESLKYLQKIFLIPESSSSSDSTQIKEKGIAAKDWVFELDLDYFGILIPLGSTFFIVELHSLMSGISSVSQIQNRGTQTRSGHLSFMNAFFMIKDRSIPNNLSKVMNFSFKLSTEKMSNEPDRSFEIESSHFRLCFCPESLSQLLWGIQQCTESLQYFKDKSIMTFTEPEIDSPSVAAKGELPISIHSFHILSYNFCIGWIFPSNSRNIPGFILGYDRLFSAYEENYGKLTLIDGYLSLANGSTTDTFYSVGNERMRYNRCYLPNMQILFWTTLVNELKQLSIRIHGEQFVVSFLSNFVDIIELAFLSFHHFQNLKKRNIHPLKLHIHEEQKPLRPSNALNPLLSYVQKVNCKVHYDGGVFNIFSEHENAINSKSLLEIKTPKVSIDLSYKFLNDCTRQHWIRCIIDIEPTFNQLYAFCVPFLKDVAHSIRNIFNKGEEEPFQSSTSSNISKISIKELWKNFDISFKILSGSQRLVLSCEPKAKVEANIGFQSFTFTVLTNDKDPSEPLTCTFSFNDIELSIKHEFSKEPSAAFNVKFIDTSVMFTHPQIQGVALISDVDVLFKIKQIQNLSLFLDIWNLSETFKVRPNKSMSDSNEKKTLSPSILSHDNNVLPLSFNVIFTSINGKISMGQALGVLSLNLQKTWLSIDHFKDKRRFLHFHSSNLSITSVGRLGGLVDIDNVSWVLAVNFVNNSSFNNAPIVGIDLKIENIAVKAAFDYHMFLIATAKNVNFNLNSEKDPNHLLPDLLAVGLVCEEINISSTALIASILLDIHNTLMRTRQDNKASYLEILKESNNENTKPVLSYAEVLKSLNLLRTDLSVDLHKINLHVSPISLFDAEVIVVTVQDVSASSETHAGKKLKTELKLNLLNATLSLSRSKVELDEEKVSKITVKDYMQYASSISGGRILDIPKLSVTMTTWQEEQSKIIEFIYVCKFDGKVSVKWNLSPVNFIKEVWATHVRSLTVRRSQLNEARMSMSEPEKAIEEIATSSDEFQYEPKEEPQIEMPQIGDLQDATPPLEWFGVNRKHFPAATHQVAILPIQKLVHLAQKEYVKVLDDTVWN